MDSTEKKAVLRPSNSRLYLKWLKSRVTIARWCQWQKCEYWIVHCANWIDGSFFFRRYCTSNLHNDFANACSWQTNKRFSTQMNKIPWVSLWNYRQYKGVEASLLFCFNPANTLTIFIDGFLFILDLFRVYFSSIEHSCS